MDRNRFALGQWLWRGLLISPLLFLLLFFFYPLASILSYSLFPEGQPDLSGFARLVTSDYYLNTFGFTLGQALLSTGLTLLLALPSAYVFARFQFPAKSLLLSLSTLPFVLPTVVVAAAFLALIGPRGLVNVGLMSLLGLDAPPIRLERTLTLILIVHVFYNYPVALRIIASYWTNLNPRLEQAAQVLGANGWRLWWAVRLPLLRPAIMAAGLLVFTFTFTSFGVVLLLGGPQFATIEVEIYRQTANLFNLPMAAALSLVQIGFMLALMLAYARLQRRLTGDLASAVLVARPPATRQQWLLVAVNLLLMIALLFAPLLALLVMSFQTADGLSLQYYAQLSTNARGSVLFVPPLQAIGNSLVFALLAMVLAVAFGTIAAYGLANRRRGSAAGVDVLFMLPLVTSAVTLGFGYIIAFDEPPFNWRTSAWLIPLSHTLVAMPFVVRTVLPALRSIPPSLQESAQVLGASRSQVWRLIELPLISRSLIVGATFAFTVSMGEFGASLFIARPDTPTIPVVIFRLLGQPGALNYGQALAMSALLMLVCALSFVLIERLRTLRGGEF